MLKETFGEMLYVSESVQMAEFPSPDELKGKIIISTKAPKEYLQTQSGKEEEAEEQEGVWGEEISDDKTTARQARASTACCSLSDSSSHNQLAGYICLNLNTELDA